MITANTVVIGVQPDISETTFERILKASNSPAAGIANDAYAVIQTFGISPAFLLAIFNHESNFATNPDSMVVRYKTFNPGNCRSSTIGDRPIQNTEKGQFVIYKDWVDGFTDMAHRLIDSRYPYAKTGAETIGEIINIWAPPSENDTPVYINSVVTSMNQWIGSSSDMAAPQQYFIQWQGTNGNNFWAGREGESVVAICDHIMQGTMESSDGWFKNPKSQVSAHFGVAKDGRIWQWVALNNRAWANGIPENPDTFIPWIADAMDRKKNPNDFTVSIEHEGNTGDPMPEAQYQATLWLHRFIMSQFPAITPDRQHIIGHYQISHISRPNCPGTGFPWARLIVDLNNGGISTVSSNQTPIPAQPATTTLNGHTLGGGFRDFYNRLAGYAPNLELLVLGLPVTNEFDCDINGDGKNYTVQLFERSGLVYEQANASPWDNHAMTTAQLENALAAAKTRALM